MIVFRDIYYAVRLDDGVLVSDIGAVADPGSVPVVVLRYFDDGVDITAICHSDLDVVEINGELCGGVRAEVVRGLLGEFRDRLVDAPDPDLMLADVIALEIVRELDYKFINDVLVAGGQKRIPLPTEPMRVKSSVRRCVD